MKDFELKLVTMTHNVNGIECTTTNRIKFPPMTNYSTINRIAREYFGDEFDELKLSTVAMKNWLHSNDIEVHKISFEEYWVDKSSMSKMHHLGFTQCVLSEGPEIGFFIQELELFVDNPHFFDNSKFPDASSTLVGGGWDALTDKEGGC